MAFVRSIFEYTNDVSENRTKKIITDDLSSCRLEDRSLVLVIGDSFPIFEKQPGCLYGFINFSVIYYYRNVYPDKRAKIWIRQKFKNYLLRLKHYDFMLEYDPLQFQRLKTEFPAANIYRFLPSIGRVVEKPSDDFLYDVGFVGNLSKRRRKVLDKLKSSGLKLSPSENTSLGEVVPQSKLFLNVHMFRCLTSEPRIIEALSYGACLITEPRRRFPEDILRPLVYECSYRSIPLKINSLLRNEAIIREQRQKTRAFMNTDYARMAKSQWCEILTALNDM